MAITSWNRAAERIFGRSTAQAIGQPLQALLAGTDSIRDVIASPKTGGGFDPLTEAPAPITPEQRKEAGVDATPEPASAERA